jgi:hypothetical protein
MLEGFDLNTIHDVEGARQAIVQLLNLVEDLASDNRELRDENQRLRDEINRLKGEQGKPKIKPNRPTSPPTAPNHSSERERHKGQARQKSRKVEQIAVNREQVLTVDRARLPADAEFKGYDDVIIQDIKIETDNVLRLRARKSSIRNWSARRTWPSCPLDTRGSSGRGSRR